MPISNPIPPNQKAAFAYGIPLGCLAGFLAGAFTELPRDCFSCQSFTAHLGAAFFLGMAALASLFFLLVRRGFPDGIPSAFGWRLFPTVLACALLSHYPGYELGERLARQLPARDSQPFSPSEASAPARAIAARFALAGFDEFRCDGSSWSLRLAELRVAASARRHIVADPWIRIPTPVTNPGCPVDGLDVFVVSSDGRPEVNPAQPMRNSAYTEDSAAAWEALARPERQQALARIEAFDFLSIPKPAIANPSEPEPAPDRQASEPTPPRDRH